MQKSQAGFVQLLLIILLLIGIGVGVYLVQFTQVFKPKAAEPPITSSAQYGSTPKSEINMYPKPAYPVQIGVVYGVHETLSAPERAFLAKEVDYFFFDQGSLARSTDGSGDYKTLYDQTPLYNEIKALKTASAQAGTNIKVGSHGGMPAGIANFHIIFNYLGNPAEQAVEKYFLHRNGERIMSSGHWQIRAFNMGSAEARQKLIDSWTILLNDHPELDSFLLDGMIIPAPNVAAEYATPCDEGPCNLKSFWDTNIISLDQSLKAVANTKGKEFFYNGAFEVPDYPAWKEATLDPPGLRLNAGFAQYSDGTLAEHFHAILQDSRVFKNYMDGLKWIVSQNKKVFVWAQPQTFCLIANQGKSLDCPGEFVPFNGVNYPLNLDLERFYLASFLLIQKNPYTYFGYNPGTFYTLPSFFYADWNKDYGSPQGDFVGPADGDGLYLRSMLNSLVVVNPTDRSLPVHLPVTGLRIWDPVSGDVAVQDQMIPPKSGRVYFNPLPDNTITVSGRLYDKNTNQPLPAGLTVETCPHSGRTNPVTGTNGTFTFQIPKGQAYCIRGPQVPGYPTIEAVNHPASATVTTSYEWQVSGYDCPGNDKASLFCQGDKEDRSTDTGMDLAYTPAAAASPSPITSKPGDTDGDNDVDIFDYNIVVTDFGKKNDPNTKADLDNDNDVDIFDYNLVVGNFAK